MVWIGYKTPMSGFSLKFLYLLLVAVLSCAPVQAQSTDYDDKAAVIFTYMAIGKDDTPAGNITEERFREQMDELSNGGYKIAPLYDIIEAFQSGKPLPPKTVAITFDGADRSVYSIALPILREKGFPFTVFVPTDRIKAGKRPYMTWEELDNLAKGGASFGVHTAGYSKMTDMDEEEIRRQLNNAVTALRDELDQEARVLAYPFGEYDAKTKKIAKEMGFKAAFGQQSGVAHAGDDRFALPRFTITERYGDMDRFEMTAHALPLPISDISPADPHLTNLAPSIGFTVNEDLKKYLKSMTCFSSSEEKPAIEILNNRVELRLSKPFNEERPRINCTMPFIDEKGSEPRFRWLGLLYTIPASLLSDAKKYPVEHAQDSNDEFSVE